MFSSMVSYQELEFNWRIMLTTVIVLMGSAFGIVVGVGGSGIWLKKTDEVHVQITLLSETDQIDHTSPDEGVPYQRGQPCTLSAISAYLHWKHGDNTHREIVHFMTIVTGAGDETLGFWNVFPSPKSQVWKLSSRDLCEIAHISVQQLGFLHVLTSEVIEILADTKFPMLSRFFQKHQRPVNLLQTRSVFITDRVRDCRERPENKKRPKISLSDFLDRKLQKTSDLSKSVQGKERPFLSPGTNVGASQFFNGASADQKTKEPDLNGTLDIVLEQFKHNKENEDNARVNLEDSIQSSTVTHVTKESQIQDPRKQTNQFEGLHGKPPAPKGLVVLGGDPMPKQATYKNPFIRREKALPVYNHYASGSGWWDSDMEGIDNDEVGFNEVWEGVGSATIGGLDWH
ncbi:hypothetical protein L1987_10607 [Smallanthus sonchifolius]|uniref:Uncharacterized protein n=1 Tax=Smallanthus sonchifolius TaxID=185202 RepID=A0ACB9JSJ4_9ASTR|nr:hypothetical protein L1987_10607 [Smallanthus sonchifolius]